MPWLISDLDTPAVLVDLDKVEANLKAAQAYADEHGLKLRPHIKTHKIPAFARRQVELGAIGITCQKLGEAEVMADAGLDDILLTYNLLGEAKLARLVALAHRVRISATCDSAQVAAGLGRAMHAAGLRLPVLVECDAGGLRCGVQTPEAAVELARVIDKTPGLRFQGLMTYPAKSSVEGTSTWLEAAVSALEAAGLSPAVVSTGGTPDLYRAGEVTRATEYRPGTYVYSDRFQAAVGVRTLNDCALTVLTTVVSRPTGGRAILDAGSKTLSSDLLGMEGHGHIVEYPDAVIAKLSEEHGHVEAGASASLPGLGERVTVIPNHACVVTNLFDRVYGVRGGRVERVLEVEARGRVT